MSAARSFGRRRGLVEPEAKLVETPLEAIRTAKDLLWFAWSLHDAVALRGTIAPAHFADEMPVDEAGTRVQWPVKYRTQEALGRRTWHTMLAAMSISAIAADRPLDDAFCMRRTLDQGSPLQSAAALIGTRPERSCTCFALPTPTTR